MSTIPLAARAAMMCAGLLFAGLPAARPHQPTPPATAVVLLDGSVAPHVTAHVLEAVISGLQGDAAYGKPGLTVYVRAVTDHALGVDAALVTLHIPPVGAAPHLRSCSLFDAVCKTQQAALLRTAQADLHRAQEAVAAAARMLRHLRVPRAQRPDLVGATWAAYGLLAMPRPGMRYLVVSSALPVPPVASGPPLFTGIDIDMIYSCDADVATCLRRHLTRLQWALQLSCGAVDHVVEGHGGQAQGAGAHGLHQPAVLAGLLLGLAQRLLAAGKNPPAPARNARVIIGALHDRIVTILLRGVHLARAAWAYDRSAAHDGHSPSRPWTRTTLLPKTGMTWRVPCATP